MIGLLAVGGHLALNTAFGWAVLSSRPHRRSGGEMLLMSALLGMYVETLSIACLMFFHVSLSTAGLVVAAAMVVTAAAFLRFGGKHHVKPAMEKPAFYEWLLLFVVGEKLLFALWQLTRTHTYFDDALTHWSGRARALYGGVNWSFDAASPFFLGGDIGTRSYPLQIPIWRATNAALSGGWNEVVSRADSLIFFVIVLGGLWLAIRRLTSSRPLAAAAVFVVAAVPLHAWHAAAGYADIGVEAFVITALAALLRKEWFFAGVLMAGAVWTKSDGLVLYVPAIVCAAALLQWMQWKHLARFGLGFATVAPWVIFNQVHALGFSAGQGKPGFHSDAPGLLLKAVTLSPSSGLIWAFLIAAAIYLSWPMFKDGIGRPLITAFWMVFGSIVFVFAFTSAYQFLANETTVHRLLMQFSPMAVLVIAYGMSLRKR